MLGYLNNSFLSEKGFLKAEEWLFIQKMKELLYNNSGISYSYKIHNSYSILIELRQVIDEYRYYDINGYIVEEVRKEACDLLKNERVISSKHPELLETVRDEIKKGLSIDKNSRQLIKDEDKEKINAMYQAISNLEKVYSNKDYLSDILDLLKVAIESGEGAKVIDLSEGLVSSIIVTKRSISSCYRYFENLFERSGASFEDCWNRWVGSLYIDNAKYKCYFNIDEKYADKVENAVKGAEIKIMFSNADNLNIVEDTKFYYVVDIEVPSNDRFAIVNKAFNAYKKEMSVVEFATAKVKKLEDKVLIYDIYFDKFFELGQQDCLANMEYKPYNQYHKNIDIVVREFINNLSCEERNKVINDNQIKLLLALLQDDTEDVGFLQNCRNSYELLYYRGIELKNFLKNTSSIRKKLERHKVVLGYQLQRMYRVRNKFMHHSIVDDNIEVLCKHVKVYMWETIREMSYVAVKRKIHTLEELYAYFRMNHAMMLKMLTNTNSPIDIYNILNGYL